MAWTPVGGAAAVWNGPGEELLDEDAEFERDEEGRAMLAERTTAVWTPAP